MTKKEQQFVRTVRAFYKKSGRHTLPWRKTKNPYRILVSEIMLQQTQVERVLPKYKEFLKVFPTMRELKEASLGDVLRTWQGLGYNRRAQMLHECAKICRGALPKTYEELVTLPGIGSYTAGAVMAFAHNVPVPVIETNIRTVYLHHFFENKKNVSDSAILEKVEKTLDTKNPREWYWALMDYGAFLKKKHGNTNVRSRHYTKQSRFKGSDREIRGAIVRTLAGGKSIKELSFDTKRVEEQLEKLVREGMIVKVGKGYRLP
ncbi:A/G-specific adenine glycosylase [Candidatus Kaiserbacteria bacterium]|nr:A/G-specific adenine glycosylase [Candidatus Kaiserbacteria bacterium]